MREAIENLLDEVYEHRASASEMIKRGTTGFTAGAEFIEGAGRLAELNFMIGRLKEVLENEPFKFGERARIRGTEHHLPTEKEGET